MTKIKIKDAARPQAAAPQAPTLEMVPLSKLVLGLKNVRKQPLSNGACNTAKPPHNINNKGERNHH